MKTIALIVGSSRPIPATLGGATQTMMNHLIDENEVHQRFHFVIYSYYEIEAERLSKKYKYTRFEYYMPGKFDNIIGLPSRAMRKITHGKTYIKTSFVKWCINKINSDSEIECILIEGNYFQVLQIKKGVHVPLVLHMHIDGLHDRTDNGLNIMNACKGIIAISDYCKKSILSIDQSQESKVHVLKNAIDVEKFKPLQGFDEDAIRVKYGIKENEIVLIYCGRLDPNKGVEELEDAFIQMNNSDYCLLIVGSSAYKDGKSNFYIKKLHDKAINSNSHIIFTGYVKQDDLPQYYSLSKIAIVPSKCEEAAGNVTIEALACGIPVITTTKGGIPEYADESACILVKADKDLRDNLTEAMKIMLDNEKIYNEKKENARNIALKYSKEIYYENFTSIMNTIMGEKWK